jgi:4'-phosphopantetheinyl transferase
MHVQAQVIVETRHHAGPAMHGRSGADLRSVFPHATARAGGPASRGALAVTLLDVREWRSWRAGACTLLSAGEVERVQRRRVANHREALTLAYALHRLLLGEALGLGPERVPLYRDERGCPRLAGDIAYTSLSHADGWVAVAISLAGPVGVDIEARARAGVMPEIAACVCAPSEVAALDVLGAGGRAADLLALWVRKEALLKAAGVGLSVPMPSFAGPVHDALVLPMLFGAPVQVRMLDAGGECVAAVAGPSGTRIDCQWRHPSGEDAAIHRQPLAATGVEPGQAR